MPQHVWPKLWGLLTQGCKSTFMLSPPCSSTAAAAAGGNARLEVVHDDRVVATPVVGPGLRGERLVGAAGRVGLGDVGLGAHAVQVLVQAVQQERQQLLRGAKLGYTNPKART